MSSEHRAPGLRVADVLAAVASQGDRSAWAAHLVHDCAGALDAVGVGLALADDTGLFGVAAVTPGAGRAGEDLQFALGEGPCQLACQTRRMVHAPCLAEDGRWLQFASEASQWGIRAAFAAPLQVGAQPIGALNVHRSAVGGLSLEDSATVAVYAQAATAVLLLAASSDYDLPPGDDLADLADVRPVVHQASGMVAVQLDVDLATALLRLRAQAFGSGRALRDVAAAVITRQVVFDHTSTGAHSALVDQPPGDTDDASGRHDPDQPDLEQRNPDDHT